MYAKTDRKSSEGDAIKWTKLERVMLSSHLLPHFYSCSNCKGHVKRMIGSFKNEKKFACLDDWKPVDPPVPPHDPPKGKYRSCNLEVTKSL